MASFVFILYLLMFDSNSSLGAPIGNKLLSVPTKEMFEFMRKFGYLDKGPSNAEALYGEIAVIDAIKTVQKYGALPQTGELNDDTIRLMTSPRCGVADVVQHNQFMRQKRYVIGSNSWNKRRITYFIANWSVKVGEEEVAKYMARAFDAWAKYSNLRFVRSFDPSADIIVGFGSRYHGDSYPFDGPGNILAHAFYPYEMNSYGGDIHFDEDENWRENSTDLSEGVDFYSVAIHELGHSLGLAHSHVYSSIMFPYYKGITQGNLDYDDILALYKLYIQNPNLMDDTIYTTEKMEEDIPEVDSTTTPEVTSTLFDPSENDVESTSTFYNISVTFMGDYETVDEHKTRHKYSTSAPESNQIPNICTGNFDAVSVIRGEVFIFKGDYLWRLNENYRIRDGYPVEIGKIFTGFPKNVHKIDAAYERDFDNNIILFSGSFYWIFDGLKFVGDQPRPLTDFGILEDIKTVDAAMVWAKNGKTYLFSGSLFWRFSEDLQKLDYGYPKSIERWYGIPGGLDAATTMPDGKTYFFKENYYWLYNNEWVRPERGYPRKTGNVWFGCR